MTEDDSFLVTLKKTFTVPQPTTNGPLALQFTFSAPAFDHTTTNAIKDAFEAALVDDQGNPLTYLTADSHDAFFNISDGQPPTLASGVTLTPLNPQLSTVSLDLSHLFPGQDCRLIFRLINNDRDRATSVRIVDVKFHSLASLVATLSAPITLGGSGVSTAPGTTAASQPKTSTMSFTTSPKPSPMPRTVSDDVLLLRDDFNRPDGAPGNGWSTWWGGVSDRPKSTSRMDD